MTPKKRNSVFGVMMGKGGKPGDPQQSGDGLMSERAEESTASDSNADDLLNDATELGAPIFTMTDDDPDHLLDEPPPSPGHSETVRFMIHNYSNLPYKIEEERTARRLSFMVIDGSLRSTLVGATS